MIFFRFCCCWVRSHPQNPLRSQPSGADWSSYCSNWCCVFRLLYFCRINYGVARIFGSNGEKKFMCAHRIHQFGVKVNLEEIDWNFLWVCEVDFQHDSWYHLMFKVFKLNWKKKLNESLIKSYSESFFNLAFYYADIENLADEEI